MASVSLVFGLPEDPHSLICSSVTYITSATCLLCWSPIPDRDYARKHWSEDGILRHPKQHIFFVCFPTAKTDSLILDFLFCLLDDFDPQ